MCQAPLRRVVVAYKASHLCRRSGSRLTHPRASRPDVVDRQPRMTPGRACRRGTLHTTYLWTLAQFSITYSSTALHRSLQLPGACLAVCPCSGSLGSPSIALFLAWASRPGPVGGLVAQRDSPRPPASSSCRLQPPACHPPTPSSSSSPSSDPPPLPESRGTRRPPGSPPPAPVNNRSLRRGAPAVHVLYMAASQLSMPSSCGRACHLSPCLARPRPPHLSQWLHVCGRLGPP